MKTMTIRGINEQLAGKIRELSRKRGESMNKTVIHLLKEASGLSQEETFTVYHDLDSLAGTWTVKEEDEFHEQTRPLREIDREMWR